MSMYINLYTANGNFAKVLITKHLHKNESSNYNHLKHNMEHFIFFYCVFFWTLENWSVYFAGKKNFIFQHVLGINNKGIRLIFKCLLA